MAGHIDGPAFFLAYFLCLWVGEWSLLGQLSLEQAVYMMGCGRSQPLRPDITYAPSCTASVSARAQYSLPAWPWGSC